MSAFSVILPHFLQILPFWALLGAGGVLQDLEITILVLTAGELLDKGINEVGDLAAQIIDLVLDNVVDLAAYLIADPISQLAGRNLWTVSSTLLSAILPALLPSSSILLATRPLMGSRLACRRSSTFWSDQPWLTPLEASSAAVLTGHGRCS